MTGAVLTVAKPTIAPREVKWGNLRVKFFDITADTGDYAAGGFTKTAAELGLKSIFWAGVGSMATDGTSGATAEMVGITYPSSTSVKFQIYQTGTSADAPFNEKGAEAYAANFTIRVMVVGTL